MVKKGTPVRTLRVDDMLWMRLEDHAAGNGLSSSEYLRRLIARDVGVNRSTLPTSGVPTTRIRDVLRDTDRYLQRTRRGRR